MIQPECFITKNNEGKKSKDNQSNYFLNDFQLPKIKRATKFVKSDSVGRHLKYIFEQSNSPAEKNYRWETPVTEPAKFFEFQMAKPSNGHKCVGNE